MGDIVRDPVDDVTSDWTRAITDLQDATRAMLLGEAGAINDAQDAITRGGRAASSLGGMMAGHLTPAQQSINARWLLALEQYQGAYNVTPHERAALPYDPNDTFVGNQNVTTPPTHATFTPEGMWLGQTVIPWWVLVVGALGSMWAASKSRGAASWQ